MIPTTRLLVAGALALSAAGCAHVSPPSSARARDSETPTTMVVTGSRIPRPVDPRTGFPATFSPVSVYTRDDILATGLPGDLGAALMRLDSTVGR